MNQVILILGMELLFGATEFLVECVIGKRLSSLLLIVCSVYASLTCLLLLERGCSIEIGFVFDVFVFGAASLVFTLKDVNISGIFSERSKNRLEIKRHECKKGK